MKMKRACERWPSAVMFSEREEIFPSANLESLFKFAFETNAYYNWSEETREEQEVPQRKNYLLQSARTWRLTMHRVKKK